MSCDKFPNTIYGLGEYVPQVQKPTGEQMLRETLHFAAKHGYNCATLDVQHIQDVLYELTALKLQRDHWKAVAMKEVKS